MIIPKLQDALYKQRTKVDFIPASTINENINRKHEAGIEIGLAIACDIVDAHRGITESDLMLEQARVKNLNLQLQDKEAELDRLRKRESDLLKKLTDAANRHLEAVEEERNHAQSPARLEAAIKKLEGLGITKDNKPTVSPKFKVPTNRNYPLDPDKILLIKSGSEKDFIWGKHPMFNCDIYLDWTFGKFSLILVHDDRDWERINFAMVDMLVKGWRA